MLLFEFEEECKRLKELTEKIGEDGLRSIENKHPKISTIISKLIISKLNKDELPVDVVEKVFTSEKNGELELPEIQQVNDGEIKLSTRGVGEASDRVRKKR